MPMDKSVVNETKTDLESALAGIPENQRKVVARILEKTALF
jgi:DNA-directed RNA polymerase specialized sigma24 family protein